MTLILRPRRVNDIPALRILFEAVFGAWPGDAWWHWKYHGHPESKALAYVAEDRAQGTVVGHVAALVLPGSDGPVAQVMDVMVHPCHRSLAHAESGLYTALMQRLMGELSVRDALTFAFGFAGLRPFRLGARLGLYRAVHACFLKPLNSDPIGRGWERLPWHERHLQAYAKCYGHTTPPVSMGPLRDADFLRWRYAVHPQRAYALWRTPEGFCITSAPRATLLMEHVGRWTGAMPGIALEGWHRAPFLDRGFGPVQPEPMMIASQVVLRGQGVMALPEHAMLQPGDTDVL